MADQRIELAKQKLSELESKLEKVKGSPREEEFQIQVRRLGDPRRDPDLPG